MRDVEIRTALGAPDSVGIGHVHLLRPSFREQHVLLQRFHDVLVHLDENI